MEKPTQKDPKMDWGFYAMTPRIVRTKYKELSHTEKWLYTCLRDLCGKKGTCFRSLRSLKEETDISIASLSAMIPRLHAAGLIHAEKKRRSASGKEIWHISIVDIWQMNKDYCSENEQSNGEDVQNLNNDPEIVHSVNNDVQNLNKDTEDCSENERDCSNFRNRRRDSKNKDTEIYNEEEGTYRASGSQEQECADAQSARALLSHPEHRFLWFDDLMAPTIMVVRFTPSFPHPYFSEIEDKRRGHIADEIRYHLEQRGLKIATRSEHETASEGAIVESSQDEPTLENTPYRPLGPLSQFFEDAIAGAQQAGVSPIATEPPQATVSQETHSETEPAPASGYQKPDEAEQDALIERPAIPEMPLQSARWCAETATLVSEALRGKYYTDKQRANQVSAARRMFRDFKTMTRPQFEEIFTDWAKWWRDHDKGYFTLADLLARGQNREVRLQTALDRMEAREAKKVAPSAPPKPTSSSLPSYSGMSDAEYYASLRKGSTNARAAYAR